MIHIDRRLLDRIAPNVSGKKLAKQNLILDQIAGPITGILNGYKINTALRIAHCLAQLAHESDGYCTTEEYASGAAYENRDDLGNSQPGDGKRYKGRGLIQLTGRANYKTFGAKIGLDLEDNPLLAADPVTSLKIACEYWKNRDLNKHADRDDLRRITRLINGGLRGLDDRRRYLRLAKNELADRQSIIIGATASPDLPILRRGSRSLAVADLQEALVDQGYNLTIDGDFGPATEAIVKVFQAANNLVVDGIVGPASWAKLGITTLN